MKKMFNIERRSILLFVGIAIVSFFILYNTTYTYSAIKLNNIISANDKIYIDTGYGINEHFSVKVINGTAVVSPSFVNIELIKNIYAKTDSVFSVVPFSLQDSKKIANKYIYYQIVLAILVSCCVLFIINKRHQITHKIREFYMDKISFCVLFFICIINFASFITLCPQISYDSAVAFSVYGNPSNFFSFTFITICIFSYILFGKSYILLSIIYTLSSVVIVFFMYKIVSIYNKKVSIIIAVLLPFLPFLLGEQFIPERVGMGIVAVAALVVSIHYYITRGGNRCFYLVLFMQTIATTSRYDLIPYFMTSMYLFYCLEKKLIRSLLLSFAIPSLILGFFIFMDNLVYGNCAQFNKSLTTYYKMCNIGYLVRDNLLAEVDRIKLGKHVDLELIKKEWGEGHWAKSVKPIKYQKGNPDAINIINSIYRKYVMMYPVEFIKSRIKQFLHFEKYLFKYSPRSANKTVSIGKFPSNAVGHAIRFIKIESNELSHKIIKNLKKTNVISIIFIILSFIAILKGEHHIPNLKLPFLFILSCPIAKSISLFMMAPMATPIYILDISLMIILVLPIIAALSLKKIIGFN